MQEAEEYLVALYQGGCEMSTEQEQKKAQEIMDFRYALIAELLNPYLSPAARRELMREKAGRPEAQGALRQGSLSG